jgi:phospholipase/carboxylesterase
LYGWGQSEEVIRQAEQRVFDSIDAVREEFHVARERCFLAGFDCGGTMAFRVAMNYPDCFAGVLSLCGGFPCGWTPLGRLTEARRLPVLLSVGRGSRKYPSTAVCDHLRLFHTAGLSVTLRQYPCGHELTPQMLADVDRWIMEQVTSGGCSTAEADHLWSGEPE